MIELELPWPARDLHPNGRVHWAVRSRAAKIARNDAALLLRQQVIPARRALVPPDGDIHAYLYGYATDKRRRDADGLLSSMKPALDGLADALGVDDRRFIPHPRVMKETRRGGVVVVVLAWGDGDVV